MKTWDEQLYRLLPAVYQLRDTHQGEPLKMLLRLIGEQAQLVEDDMRQLYENWFIETCQDWVVPYLGDLIGFNGAEGPGQPSDATTVRGQRLNRFLYPRREIATLVRRRRRKGTASVLEDVAWTVANWPARAVEFSRLVAFFQNVKHPRPELGRTVCVRDRAATARVQTPFDRLAHTVDVRQMQALPGVGWYHPYKVGLFVWRRQVYSATEVRPCRRGRLRVRRAKGLVLYAFDRLGQDRPLYVNRQKETDEFGIAGEQHLPVPLDRHLLRDEKGLASNDYYGLGRNGQSKSLAIRIRWKEDCQWKLVPNHQVHVCDLGGDCRRNRALRNLPNRHVAVDPERGLFVTKSRRSPRGVRVTYHYSATAEVGGGEYDRPITQHTQIPTIRLRRENCPATQDVPELFDKVLEEVGPQGTACGIDPNAADVQIHRLEIPAPSTLPNDSPRRHRHHEEHPAHRPAAEPTAAKPTVQWTVKDSVCIELTGSDTYQISCEETLSIDPGKTLELRGAARAWPLLKIRTDGKRPCGGPWRVRLGVGSRLVLDGLQITGATIQFEELEGDTPPIDPLPDECECPAPAGSAVVPGGTPAAECEKHEPQAPADIVIRHTTFAPGGRTRGGCDCAPNHASITACLPRARLCIRQSIMGTLNIEHPRCRHAAQGQPQEPYCPADPLGLHIADSIIDSASGLSAIGAGCCHLGHADLTVERSTVLGNVCVQQISRAEDCLFTELVHVQRRGHGYMRFCFVPDRPHECQSLDWLLRPDGGLGDSEEFMEFLFDAPLDASRGDWCCAARTPQRFKCLPEPSDPTTQRACSTGCGETAAEPPPTADASRPLRPVFVSLEYGHPGYCQLALNCPAEILRGAEDESELGVYHHLHHTQRGARLAARLQEYTPAEIESAVIYADDLRPALFRRFSSLCERD